MKIALSVNYVLDVENRNDFYNVGNGYRRDDIVKELSVKFPNEIKLSENVKGIRNGEVACVPLYENKNCVRCDCCGKYLSLSKELPLSLDCPTEANGRTLCGSCVWELRGEL